MYAISNAIRVYITSFFLLCAAVLFAPTVNAAAEYWSPNDGRFISERQALSQFERVSSDAIRRPANSSLSIPQSAPQISKNAANGLSVTTNNTLRVSGHPSTFTSTLDMSVSSAKNALKSCVRSVACAGRALGAGAVIYEGINSWKDVYDLTLGSNGTPSVTQPLPVSSTDPSGNTCYNNLNEYFPSCVAAFDYYNTNRCLTGEPQFGCPLTLEQDRPNRFVARAVNGNAFQYYTLMSDVCPSGSTNTSNGCVSDTETTIQPVSPSELDTYIDDGYIPEISDAPLVLLPPVPASISVTVPASIDLPAKTTVSTGSQGETTTVTNETINFSVMNNNSLNPSISSELVSSTSTYDSAANLVNTSTSTTTNPAVQPAPDPAPDPAAPIEFDLPSFCSWASVVCDWIGWTKEGIEGEEPDLITLMSEFEPDENQYNSGIGSGSCPAPMSLNLGIINRTVEVSYQPFCDFLDMIRPLVIAGAWLLSAFMYVGVLRRG